MHCEEKTADKLRENTIDREKERETEREGGRGEMGVSKKDKLIEQGVLRVERHCRDVRHTEIRVNEVTLHGWRYDNKT